MNPLGLQGPPMTPPDINGYSVSPPGSVAASSPLSVASPERLRSPSAYRSPSQQLHQDSMLEKPRLVIRKLVLINYKSYAGRQEVGPFNTSFTAVVGPNGSGKSNVIDSLLFVFGFRAKKMRQSKLTGLIHKSEQQPNLTFARVEVHFETLGVPDSELVLGREVRADGTNFYTLNDKRATYTEVSELLESKGIDLRHKRFLILQGEVESIALMPPKAENDGDDGLLEYLEDIIGTSTYKLTIDELSKQSEELKVECGEKQRRADHVSKDLAKLDADRQIVETFVINKNRSILAQSQLYQLKLYKSRSVAEFLKKELSDVEKELAEMQSQVSEKRLSIERLMNENSEKDTNLQNLKSDLDSISSQLKQIQVLEAKLKQQHDQLAARRKKAEKGLAHATKKAKEAQYWLDNYATDTEKLEDKHKELVQREVEERRVLDGIQAELHESTKHLRGELQALQHEAEPWRVEINDIDHKIKALDSQRKEIELKVKNSKKAHSKYLQTAEDLANKEMETKTQLQTAHGTYSDLSEQQQSIDLEIKNAEESMKTAEQYLNQLKPELSAAQESKVTSQSRNRIEQTLKDLKIPGFYGRLGSLGTIDAKYDIAVSTAGPELNNMVVDNVETAQKCINVLRERNLGRARFMSLDKLHNPNQNIRPDNFPATRLIDLVKPKDPVLYRAFFSALGNTLVVENMRKANEIATYGGRRYKVVTLDGGLIKTTGQMSAGGRPSRGMMNHVETSMSAVELSKLEQEVSKWEMSLYDARDKIERLNSLKEELEVSVPRTKSEINKLEMTLVECSQQIVTVRDQVSSAESALEAARKEYDDFLEDSAKMESELNQSKASLMSRSSSIEKAINEIQEKILNAGGIRLREQKSKVDDISTEIQDIEQRIDEGRHNYGLQMSSNKKFTAEIHQYQQELESYNESSISAENIPDSRELITKKEALSANIQAIQNEINSAKEQINILKDEINSARTNEVEKVNEKEKFLHRLRDTEKSILALENKVSSFTLYDESFVRELKLSDTDMDEEMQDSTQAPLPELSPDELESLDQQDIEAAIHTHEKACEGKRFDVEVIERYRARFKEYRERRQASDESLKSYETVKDEYERMKNRRYTEFMEGFSQISSKLKEMYQLITMGGNAELELVDSMDPFAEGILFSVMPPKKSWRNIANLSGGEKTLSSLALVFALHHYKPTPLYVMDEIDAALDFRNVSIIANYIKERTKNGQFIVISLRNNMFELASRLVGIYKINNMTQSATIQVNSEE